MKRRDMSQKKIFLFIIAIGSLSLLLHHGGHWTMDVFRIGCPTIRSHPAPGLKPKHTNVAFLKTHKTASSTMQNLMFRFAERNNLTVALPITASGHQFGYPSTFSSRYVHPHTLPANIITNHMRLNKTELRRLMPNDTIFITILREPVSMFESLFSYYNQYCQTFKRVPNGSLEVFLENPSHYYRAEEKYSAFAHNTITYDLGGDKDRPSTDLEYIRGFLAEIEQTFSLVMISEYFDESLVLLRHLLNWDLDDILYVKLNMRTANSKRTLSDPLPSKIRAWNSLDARLYDHFNASLWHQLSALGLACVEREVQLLREAQEKLMRGCFGGSKPLLRSAAQIKNKDLRPWKPNGKVDIVGYELPVNFTSGFSSPAQEYCFKLIMPEITYTNLLLRSQSLRYRRSLQRRPPLQAQGAQRPMRTALPRRLQMQRSQPAPASPGAVPAARSTSTSKSAAGTESHSAKSGPNPAQTLASHVEQ